MAIKKELGEICDLIEQSDGSILVKPKGQLSSQQFSELYIKVLKLGGYYHLGTGMQFIFPSIKNQLGAVAIKQRSFQLIPVELLIQLPFGIRTETDEISTEFLDSIKAFGVVEPLVVRPYGEKFEVICGRRRFRAAEKLGLTLIPCIICDLTDQEAMELMFIENEQRTDISDYERGRWLAEMLTKFPDIYPTQEALAKRIGETSRQTSRQYISMLISHYKHIEEQKKVLPSEIVTRVTKLPEGVTREIRKAPPEIQPKILEKVVKDDLSSRETRNLVDSLKVPTLDEAIKIVQEDTQQRVEAAKRRDEQLIKKLKLYYPEELVDKILEKTDGLSEVTLTRALSKVVSALYLTVKQQLQSKLDDWLIQESELSLSREEG
jgi:ParB family chromosome partitioning protein